MDPVTQHQRTLTRRQLLNHTCNGVGAAALTALLGSSAVTEHAIPGLCGHRIPG